MLLATRWSQLGVSLDHFLKSDQIDADTYAWHAVDRGINGHERRYEQGVFRAHLTAAYAMLPFLTKDPGSLGGALVAAQHTLRPLLYKVAIGCLPDAMRQGWEHGSGQIRTASRNRQRSFPGFVVKDLTAMFSLDWPEIANYIYNRAQNYSPMIAATSIARFRQVLVDGFNRGVGIDQMKREIMAQQLPEISRYRAQTIARTEIISASNVGALASYTRSTVVKRKKWLYTRDLRTRDSHKTSQIVDVRQPFVLTDPRTGRVSRLMHPGDTSMGAGLSEIVNCRCAMRPITDLLSAQPRSQESAAPPEWKPSKTVREAEQQATSAFNKSQFKNSIGASTQFHFRGIDVKAINKFMPDLLRLGYQYPGVMTRLEVVTSQANPWRPAPWNPAHYAHAALDGQFMSLNPAHFKDLTTFELQLARNANTRWLQGGNVTSVVNHEFGHLVDAWLLRVRGPAVSTGVRASGLGDVGETYRMWRRKYLNDSSYSRSVSGYATANAEEGFAESFARLHEIKAGRTRVKPELVVRMDAMLDELADQSKWIKDPVNDLRTMTESQRATTQAQLNALAQRLGLDDQII